MSARIEVRSDTGNNTVTLSTYASLFEPVAYEIRGGGMRFMESVAPDAFNQTLKGNPDVVFRTEHQGPPLARTTAGNLKLFVDRKGLRYEATLDMADPDVQALVPKVRAGNIRESSFAFRVGRDSWSQDGTQRRLELLDLHRGDVSLCTFGASPQTGHELTLRTGESVQERRAFARHITRSGWGGPGAELMRGWANQHGSSCDTCDGTGKCPDCDGQGWSPDPGDDDDGGEQNPARRRSRVVIPPSRLDEFERQLRAHRERVGR